MSLWSVWHCEKAQTENHIKFQSRRLFFSSPFDQNCHIKPPFGDSS